MSRKISIKSLKEIQWLVKEEILIVLTQKSPNENILFSNDISNYQEGTIVNLSPVPIPSKKEADEEKELIPQPQLKIKDKILFENSNVLQLIVHDDLERKYFIISKKDVLMVISN